jgi:hypothetical protein
MTIIVIEAYKLLINLLLIFRKCMIIIVYLNIYFCRHILYIVMIYNDYIFQLPIQNKYSKKLIDVLIKGKANMEKSTPYAVCNAGIGKKNKK